MWASLLQTSNLQIELEFATKISQVSLHNRITLYADEMHLRHFFPSVRRTGPVVHPPLQKFRVPHKRSLVVVK